MAALSAFLNCSLATGCEAVASIAAAGVAAFAALTKGQRQDAKRKQERALIREAREKGKQEVKQRKAAEKAANSAKEDEAALLKASRAAKEEQITQFQNQTP